MDIIIVGNGPSALGKPIDDFDIVVRLNQFRLDGYNVGQKMTVWSNVVPFNLAHHGEILDRHKCLHYINCVRPRERGITTDRQNITRIMQLAFKYEYGYPIDVHFLGVDMVKEFERNIGCQSHFASTGLLTICYLLLYYLTIYITGFDSLYTKTYEYYWNKQTATTHDPVIERRYVESQISANRIISLE